MKSNLYKGCLEPIILRVLKEHKRMYGYEITLKVKEITAGSLQVSEGALYPLLHKLEEQGILSSEIEMEKNRPRKFYSLTPAGQQHEDKSHKTVMEFIKSIQSIMNFKNSLT